MDPLRPLHSPRNAQFDITVGMLASEIARALSNRRWANVTPISRYQQSKSEQSQKRLTEDRYRRDAAKRALHDGSDG
jgi:hypothetical protein